MSEPDKYLSRRSRQLRAYDFDSSVELMTTDGSYFNIKSAFVERQGLFHYIFTEHFAHFYVHDDEVLYIRQIT